MTLTVANIETLYNLDDATYGAALSLALPIVTAYVGSEIDYDLTDEYTTLIDPYWTMIQMVIGDCCATLVKNYNIKQESMAELSVSYVLTSIPEVINNHAQTIDKVRRPVIY